MAAITSFRVQIIDMDFAQYTPVSHMQGRDRIVTGRVYEPASVHLIIVPAPHESVEEANERLGWLMQHQLRLVIDDDEPGLPVQSPKGGPQ